jgi:aminoglycoside 6'-N-acetyltransferase
MITLRKASPSDVNLLRYWDTLPHVIDADPNDDWDWEVELGRYPAWREQLIAEDDGRPLGFVQIIDPDAEETGYWGKTGPGYLAIDIWIGEPSDLGKGYGTIMMDLAIRRCFAIPGVHAILIDPLTSNTRAHRFYERLGFEFMETRIFGEDECRVYCLTRKKWLEFRDL